MVGDGAVIWDVLEVWVDAKSRALLETVSDHPCPFQDLQRRRDKPKLPQSLAKVPFWGGPKRVCLFSLDKTLKR